MNGLVSMHPSMEFTMPRNRKFENPSIFRHLCDHAEMLEACKDFEICYLFIVCRKSPTNFEGRNAHPQNYSLQAPCLRNSWRGCIVGE